MIDEIKKNPVLNKTVIDISEINDNDVVTKGSYDFRDHKGNLSCRKIVSENFLYYRSTYLNSKKDSIKQFIVDTIHKTGGRFLERYYNDSDSSSFAVLCVNDAKKEIVRMLHNSGKKQIWTKINETAITFYRTAKRQIDDLGKGQVDIKFLVRNLVKFFDGRYSESDIQQVVGKNGENTRYWYNAAVRESEPNKLTLHQVPSPSLLSEIAERDAGATQINSCKTSIDRRLDEDEPNNRRDNNNGKMTDEAKTNLVLDTSVVIDIDDINDNDVLITSHRGNRICNRKGNIVFWNLVSENSHRFNSANSTSERNEIKQFIFDTIHKTGGRFLHRNNKSSNFTVLCVDEAKVMITRRIYYVNKVASSTTAAVVGAVADINNRTQEEVTEVMKGVMSPPSSLLLPSSSVNTSIDSATKINSCKTSIDRCGHEDEPNNRRDNNDDDRMIDKTKTNPVLDMTVVIGSDEINENISSNSKDECNKTVDQSSLLSTSAIIAATTATATTIARVTTTATATATAADTTTTTVAGPTHSTVSTIVNKNSHITTTGTKENYENSKKPEDPVIGVTNVGSTIAAAAAAAAATATATADTDTDTDTDADTSGDNVDDDVDSAAAYNNDDDTNKAYAYNHKAMRTISSKEEVINIFVPLGKLGFVVHISPDDEIPPIVRIIKDTSSLAGKVQVGDKLVAVDNEDLRTLTGIQLFKLFDPNSVNQSSRKLTLLRTTTSSGININYNNNSISSNRCEEQTKEKSKNKEERRRGIDTRAKSKSGIEAKKETIEVHKELKGSIVKNTFDACISQTNPIESSSTIEKELGHKNSTQESTKTEFTRGVSKSCSFSLPLSNHRLQKFKRSGRIDDRHKDNTTITSILNPQQRKQNQLNNKSSISENTITTCTTQKNPSESSSGIEKESGQKYSTQGSTKTGNEKKNPLIPKKIRSHCNESKYWGTLAEVETNNGNGNSGRVTQRRRSDNAGSAAVARTWGVSTSFSSPLSSTRALAKPKSNRGLQKFKRSARVDDRRCEDNNTTTRILNTPKRQHRLNDKSSNTFETMSHKSKKRNPCQQEASNESKKRKYHQQTATLSDFVEGGKRVPSNLCYSMGNTGSGEQKLENLKTVTKEPRNRYNGDDDGYESWTEGSWSLLLPYDCENVQPKSATKVLTNCSQTTFTVVERQIVTATTPSLSPKHNDKNSMTIMVKKPHRNDILLGRGISPAPFGNLFYRSLIEKYHPNYVKCTTSQQKDNIIQLIFAEILNTNNPPGRFLKRNDKTKMWTEISRKEARRKLITDLNQQRSLKRRNNQQTNDSSNERLGPRNRNKNNGDDDGYESWTEGSWCLLLPHDKKNIQAKSTTKVMVNCSKLQLGDRKSIRIVTKRSLLDTGGNYEDKRVSKKRNKSIKSKSQHNLMLENQRKKKISTTTCTVVERQLDITNTPSLAPQQNDKNIMAIMILSSNDSRSNTLYNTGQLGTTSMTRSALLEPTYPDDDAKRHSDKSNPKSGSVTKKLEASGSNCIFNNALQEARGYMLTKYGKDHIAQNEGKDIVMV